jgi:hypothetical protein
MMAGIPPLTAGASLGHVPVQSPVNGFQTNGGGAS